MFDKEYLTNYHNRELETALRHLDSEAAREDDSVTLEEASYDILLNAGMIQRYTGSCEWLEKAMAAPGSEHRYLVINAMNYAKSLIICSTAEDICSKEVVEDSDLELADAAIEHRDGLEEALRVASLLAGDLIDAGDDEVIDRIIDGRLLAARFDEVFRENPEIAAVATRDLECLLDFIAVEIDPKDYWWFFEARSIDDDLEARNREMGETLREGMYGFTKEVSAALGRYSRPVVAALSSTSSIGFASQASRLMHGLLAGFMGNAQKKKDFEVIVVSNEDADNLTLVFIDSEDGTKTTELDGRTVTAERGGKTEASAEIDSGTCTLTGVASEEGIILVVHDGDSSHEIEIRSVDDNE